MTADMKSKPCMEEYDCMCSDCIASRLNRRDVMCSCCGRKKAVMCFDCAYASVEEGMNQGYSEGKEEVLKGRRNASEEKR
jgi:hypothetical protein